MKKISLSKSSRYGIVSVIISIVAVIAIILVNVVVSKLTDKFGWRLDMTESGTYTISEDSIQFAKSIDKPVEMYVLSSESEFDTGYKEILLKYQAASSNISISYVDIVKNPEFADDKLYSDLELKSGGVVITCEGRARFVPAENFLSYYVNDEEVTQEEAFMQQMYGYTVETKFNMEHAITLAIKQTVAADIPSVAFITNHGEMRLSGFEKLLNQNGYTTEYIDLDVVNGKIPDTFDYVIISAPEKDYTEDEIKLLDTFLENDGLLGKNIVYLAGPNQSKKLPNIQALLEEWGISVGSGNVYETDVNNTFRYMYYGPNAALTTFVNTDLASDVSAMPDAKTVMYGGKPLDCLYEQNGNFITVPLLSYSDTVKCKPQDNETTDASDPDGPFDAMILSQYVKYGGEIGTTRFSSNIFAVSSAYFLYDDFLNVSGVSNGKYIVSLFNETLGLDYGLNIQPKELDGTKFEVTAGQTNAIGIIFIGIVPVLVLLIGLIIYLRRRHL